jgi:RNA polymerase sigma-70 factor (ECF subfamily)
MRREEIEQAFEQYGPMVFRRARAILGSSEEARDVMQDVFIKILSGGMKSEGSVSGWLNRVTTNECLDRVRDRSRRTALLRKNFIPGERADSGHEDRAIVRAMLGEVEERVASAAICVHIDGMTHDEASKHLGVSLRTVANLLTRFRERSLELLGAHEPERKESR